MTNEKIITESNILDMMRAYIPKNYTISGYTDFPTLSIGVSDCAALVLIGGDEKGHGLASSVLNFGEDGAYNAHILTTDYHDLIPRSIYRPVAHFSTYMQVLDSLCGMADGMQFIARNITIYRAGEFGCIIELEN